MRWIDIILPEPGIDREFDTYIDRARDLLMDLGAVQARDGLDSPLVIECMADIGGQLFQAVTCSDPGAFSCDPGRSSYSQPVLGRDDHDRLLGFHLVGNPDQLHLPWHWVHNGLGFLLEKHPLCAADQPLNVPAGDRARPWMQRLVRSEFLVGQDGSGTLRSILPQLRPDSAAAPEVLFVPGHTEPKMRRLIYREAEAIELALGAANLGDPLARLVFPTGAITPRELSRQGLIYQAIHFAGPTSQPARIDDVQGEYWMNRLIQEAAAAPDDALAEAAGLEGEVLGVDPVTVLLEAACERYDRNGAPDHGPAARRSGDDLPPIGEGHPSWLLSDGPIAPESLNHGGGVPPLVFSNSFCGLPDMGPRFLAAGASTFVGPAMPLFSRPARIFAGYFYDALGDGWCAGAAVWHAARACRQELGDGHPAWLGYGLHGYGTLALQYL